jgi:ABC-2 type transport system ATP-binding protein
MTTLRPRPRAEGPELDPRAPAAAAGAPAVELHRATFGYPTSPRPVLEGVDLVVHPGTVVALLGPNGAGKSTLVSLLVGLNDPTAGSASVFGRSPRQALRQGRTAAMLQSAGIADFVTVGALVSFVAGCYPDPMPAAEALELAGLTHAVKRRVERLSGGERQRVRFALTLVGRPQLLILDEPTNEMDVASRQSFWGTVREAAARDGRTVFFTTHRMDEVATAADRVVVLTSGRVMADETPNELRRRGGRPSVAFRWRGAPRPEQLARLTGDVEHVAGPDVQTLRTCDADRTLRELVGLVPDAVDLTVVEASLDDAYLSVVGSGTTTATGADVAGTTRSRKFRRPRGSL